MSRRPRARTDAGTRSRSARIATVVVGILVGLALGIGAYTFVYAKGGSYLTNDPEACANCHVMNEQFSGWVKSSHRSVAVCNDCHTPPGLVARYVTKAENGFWHSFAFTTGSFHEPIQITPRNRAVTESACRKCHAGIVVAIEGPPSADAKPLACIRCHRSVGHLD